MTMPSSGPISIGQARNECGLGNPVNAGHTKISQLAGVSPGIRFAWSWWRGRSAAIQGLLCNIQYASDRRLYVRYNIRTGAVSHTTDGDSRTRLDAFTAYMSPIPNIGQFGSVTVSVGTNNNYNGNGPGRPLISISQQPSAGNDWTFEAYFNDDPWGNAAYGDCTFYLDAH